jgi:hypothetical protein
LNLRSTAAGRAVKILRLVLRQKWPVSTFSLADVADRDRGRLSWRMADIRKPALPNGRSAILIPRAQKGLSERECVDRVVGGDIKPVFGCDERLKMVQTAHCLRGSCERLAAIGPERVQPVVALGAHDQYDRIRAAVGTRPSIGNFCFGTPRGHKGDPLQQAAGVLLRCPRCLVGLRPAGRRIIGRAG